MQSKQFDPNQYSDNFKPGLLKSPYDKRDFKLKQYLPLGAIRIPDNYQSPEISFIYNQGNTSECCACAYSSLRYLQEVDQSGLTEAFSPTYTYGSREPMEVYEGMYIRNCLKKARSVGSILYKELPGFYTVTQAMSLVNAKKADYLEKGNPFRITGFYVCRSRAEMQVGIITCKGIITGIPVFDRMYNIGSDGLVPYDPNIDTQSNGGHCILITGWKTENNKLYWRCLNSWGHEYGDHGYFWLPEEYPFMEDAYTITDDIIETTFADYRKEYNY